MTKRLNTFVPNFPSLSPYTNPPFLGYSITMFSLSPRRQATLALLVNTIIWGAALPVVKPALSFVSPYQFLFFRYLIGSVLILPLLILLLFKHRPTLNQLFTILGLETLIMVLGHSLLYYGLSLTSSLESSLIGISSPIFITLGGIFLLKEKEDRHELIGFSIALLGTLSITLEPLLGGSFNGSGSTTGNLFVLSYVLLWTSYNLIAKKLYPHISKLLIASLGLWIGTLGMLPVIYFFHPQLIHLPTLIDSTISLLSIPTVLFSSLYMAVFGTIIAIPTYIFGLSKIEASEAALFTYLQPLISIPLAIFWLHEPFKLINIVGLTLIAGGVFIAEKRTSA